MTGGLKAAKFKSLIDSCYASIASGQLQDAAASLREASALEPEDDRLVAAWETLRGSEDKTDILGLCELFIGSKDEGIGQRLMNVAKQDEFSIQTGVNTVRLLLDQKDVDVKTKTQIVNAICSRYVGRQSLTLMVQDCPTETFQRLWCLGDEAIETLVQSLTRPDAWRDGGEQSKAIRDIFLLFLAKIVEPLEEHYGMAMRSIAKLMTTNATTLLSLIDKDHLSIILSCIDIERPIALKSQATLTIAKFLEASPERGQELLKEYVISRFRQTSNDDLVAAISVAGAIFPIVPDFAARLFLTPELTDDLVRIVRKSRSDRLRRAVLELLSAACIDKGCRAKIHKTCLPWLEEVFHASVRGSNAAMAGLILSKLRQGFSKDSTSKEGNGEIMNELVTMFKSIILTSEEPEVQTSVEGLAYNSIDANVKEQLAGDPTFLQDLVKILDRPQKHSPLLFGGLTILSNLTTYPPILSAEEKRMAQLKAYANQTKLLEPNALDDEKHVTVRCKKVLDIGVASVLARAARSASSSKVMLSLTSSIFLSLSKEHAHCGTMAQQGMFDTILLLAHLDEDDATRILPHARRQSAHALARILISVDPQLLFQGADRRLEKCIGPLNFLLSHLEPSDPQCAFDALRALTNIASLNDESATLVSNTCFPSIAVYLESTRSAQQQAATECVCNLSKSIDFLLSYFLLVPEDGEPYGPTFKIDMPTENRKEMRFLRLVWLTAAKARGTRLSAMGALAAMTSTEPGRNMLTHAPDGLESVVSALNDAQSVEAGERLGLSGEDAYIGDTDMRIRAACVMNDICCSTEDVAVHRRLVRHGLVKLLNDSAKHPPKDEHVREQLLVYTEPLMQRLREVFQK